MVWHANGISSSRKVLFLEELVMSCMLHKLCNDVLLIVYRQLHRHALNECFKEINSRLQWNQNKNIYVGIGSSMDYRANWRYLKRSPSDEDSDYVYSIWSENVPRNPTTLPRRYYFSLGNQIK